MTRPARLPYVHAYACDARAGARGTTLLEVLVSLAILSMISLLIYGAFDAISRGKRGEALRADRARQGRDAVDRIGRELSAAFLSLHNPVIPALATRRTSFIAVNAPNYDRVDFAAFAHRRVMRDAKESDQCEIGYFVVDDPDVDDKKDLVRREQTPIDLDPKKGGIVNVVAEDVELFDLRYFDPVTSQWIDSWDTRQATGQYDRLPLQVKITLVLKAVRNSPTFRFTTKVMIPIQKPLHFAFPR
ncbi:MAG: prepilin-type N-terminal cleavage/methylation domain-containing protein [Myxococcales bacterium]|nr:prepilin-type N-terminal cleavage/methylation domain-containing protein [Myxococcales bacterium]